MRASVTPAASQSARLVDETQVALIDDECLAGLGLDEDEPPPLIARFSPAGRQARAQRLATR